MAEDFGIQGRGVFYDATGTIRDVIQNHVFQVLCNIAMEPPARTDSESIRNEKVKVLQAIEPLMPHDVVRGQFRGYLEEPGVKPDSTTETFAAMRLFVNSFRWQGTPFYIRAGKNLPTTAMEIVLRLRKAPQIFPIAAANNYIRMELSPDVALALGMTAMAQNDEAARAVELCVSRHPSVQEMDAYERVLGDAMAGDQTMFAREDYVEEAWRIVDPVLTNPTPVYQYEPGTWGPSEMGVAPPGDWHNITVDDPAPEARMAAAG
jgi:glucose-6-phosphate 1-dehydrogenase